MSSWSITLECGGVLLDFSGLIIGILSNFLMPFLLDFFLWNAVSLGAMDGFIVFIDLWSVFMDIFCHF